MINRDRAWRRKAGRRSAKQFKETKEWLKAQVEKLDIGRKRKLEKGERKQHRHGKLTHAQDLRLRWALGQELADELAG